MYPSLLEHGILMQFQKVAYKYALNECYPISAYSRWRFYSITFNPMHGLQRDTYKRQV